MNTKNIKTSDQQVMVRKKRQREEEQPGKETLFRLHGKEVPVDKIARYEQKFARKQQSENGGDIPSLEPGMFC